MKFLKVFSALVLTFVIIASYTAPIIKTSERVQEDVFRLHILANSDTEEDQSLKLKVRDYVLENCGVFDNCKTVEEAIAAAKENINEIEALANECLKEHWFRQVTYYSQHNGKTNNQSAFCRNPFFDFQA